MPYIILIAFLISGSLVQAESTSPLSTNEQEETDLLFPRTDPKLVGLLYQMLKVVDQLFEEHEIPYWIDGGTLLGAIRHQGIIPWDDDVDLVFHSKDEGRILALKSEFLRYGFVLVKEDVLKVYPSRSSHYPFIELAGYRLHQDNTYRYDNLLLCGYFYRFFWLPHEIDPLVRLPFGPILVNAPNDSMRYLSEGYGPDYLTHGKFKTHHGCKERFTRIRKKVRIVDFSPAAYVEVNGSVSLQ